MDFSNMDFAGAILEALRSVDLMLLLGVIVVVVLTFTIFWKRGWRIRKEEKKAKAIEE